MKKAFTIGWKDLKVTFRERAALIMLAAPFVLTLAMGFVTGAFSRDSEIGLSGIPVAVVNQDPKELGTYLEESFSEGFGGMFTPVKVSNATLARQQVEQDEVAAAVIIPGGFTESIIPSEQGVTTRSPVKIEVYANPARPISASIIRSIVDNFVTMLETGRISGQVVVTQMVSEGLISIEDAARVGLEVGGRLAGQSQGLSLITLKSEEKGAETGEESIFSPIAILAPSMALLFLIYTTSSVGGRSILVERDEGTLPRMLTTPSTTVEVLGGKVFGIFLIGFVQMGILIVASSLLFSLQWGDPLAVVVLVLAAVAGATGWGILLAAFARTSSQVSSIGTALMLLFGILGGSFFGTAGLSGVMGIFSKITPNAWAQAGFITLAAGGALADILTQIGGLLVMAAVLFTIAMIMFRHRGSL